MGLVLADDHSRQISHFQQVVKTEARLDGLTTLRFLAALYVFLFHFDLRVPVSVPTFIDHILSNGAIGMPVFFMLSGFVLGYRYHKGYSGFSRYYLSRIARIYPAYIACAIISLPLLPAIGTLDSVQGLLVFGAVLILTAMLLQAWYPNLFHYWHFAGTWSVSVEMFLYACFPVVRVLSRYHSRVLLLLSLVLILFSASLLPSNKLAISRGIEFPVFYGIPAYHLPEFVVGYMMSQLYLRHGGRPLLILGLPVLLVMLGMIGSYNYRFMTLNIVTLPLVALTIYGFASIGPGTLGVLRFALVNRAALYLGDISYSFFLMQIPVMLWLDQHHALYLHVPSPYLFVAALGTTLILAMISYHLIEGRGRSLILKAGAMVQRHRVHIV